MLRRALRLGIKLGLLAGIAVVVAKVASSRNDTGDPSPPLASRPWPRLEPDPGTTPPSRTTSLVPDPEAPVAPAPVAPAPVAPAPVAPAPVLRPEGAVKKIATKKAPAKKAAPRAAAPKAAPTAAPAPATVTAPATTWVEPEGEVCPTTHPVKAKLSSKIFHLPGMLNYDRTRPDRCYVDGDSAEADGLRGAKR